MNGRSRVARMVFALCLASGGLAVTAPMALAACPDPGANQITIYTDANFGSQCAVLGVGNYANPTQMGIHNDWMSSLKVGADVRAILFADSNFGGWEATYIRTAATMSSHDNDQVSSIMVQADPGLGLYYDSSLEVTYNQDWADEGQGLAIVPGGATYITQNNPPRLWKFATQNFQQSPDCAAPPAGVSCATMPAALSAYDHFGDPEVIADHVLVPLEGSTPPAVAVFSATDLSFQGWDELDAQTQAAWVSATTVGGSNELWSSDGNIQNTAGNRLWSYGLDFGKLCLTGPTTPSCYMLGASTAHNLYRRDGSSVDLQGLQGGDFSSSGSELYLSTGYSTCVGGDGQGVRVFDIGTGNMLARSASNGTGQFNVNANCDFPQYEEIEGLDVQSSYVSLFVLDNELWGGDHIFWKKYLNS